MIDARSLTANTSPLLEVALNGARTPGEHSAIPRAPNELARAGRAAVDAGARVIHLHPYDECGQVSLASDACAAALAAVRARCPGIPISLTTSASIEPDPRRRLEIVASWTDLPDLVTANQGEADIHELCELLIARGVGIEAGLLSVGDAEAFAGAGYADRCVRVLVEPLNAEPDEAVAQALAIENVLSRTGVALEQVHHGDGMASWAVSTRALARGHGMRTGLEDTTVLPNGEVAADNAALVRAAADLIAEAAAKAVRCGETSP